MENLFNEIGILLPEYNFFKTLPGVEKIQYFLEIYDMATCRKDAGPGMLPGINEFFDEVNDEIENKVEFDRIEFGGNRDRVDIMIDSEHIVIESNSLRAVRKISLRFVDAGYLVGRDKDIEIMFRKSKISRYLRVYKIIGQTACLCYN